MKKTNILVLIAFLTVFLLGAASGYFVGINTASNQELTDERSPRFGLNDPDRNGERQNNRMRNWLVQQLSLEEQQEEPFFRLLHENRLTERRLIRQSREEVEQAMEREHQQLMKDLEEILNPEQLQEFENRFSRKALLDRRKRHEHRERRGGGL